MNIGSFISKGHLLLTCWSDYCESVTSDNKLICISIVVLYNNFEGCIIFYLFLIILCHAVMKCVIVVQ